MGHNPERQTGIPDVHVKNSHIPDVREGQLSVEDEAVGRAFVSEVRSNLKPDVQAFFDVFIDPETGDQIRMLKESAKILGVSIDTIRKRRHQVKLAISALQRFPLPSKKPEE